MHKQIIRLDHDMICPTCKQKQDCLTSVGEQNGRNTLSPGNLAVCFYCGAINVVTDDWQLRKMTTEELQGVYDNDKETYYLLMMAR